MSTNVVEPVDLAILVLDEEELKASFFISYPRSAFGEAELVCHQDPFLGEDGSSFKFVDLLGTIPRGWQCSSCRGERVSPGRTLLGRDGFLE